MTTGQAADYDDDDRSLCGFEEDRQWNDEDVWESSVGDAGRSAGLSAQRSPESSTDE